jgi:hypothetical protein
MAKTPAERQAAYRQKHLKDETGSKARLNMLLDHRTKLALKRLAIRYGVTQAALLERLILEEQTQILQTMTSEEASKYYDSVTA